ncbi:TetR/AcrR family transcriptional regulator [Gracilibacillus sp. S3-1-1]|uniref:TetR/AcrR family transcriptional regulator n=1 Tax=Gracilibacillus pellucidus TaxID=3095368 RepID=A0ACC6M8E6_9BACI|nr:TetR/AcrR family transcriptional regulator [Gracilibacillus sp. S3-1-1]MDX8047235.1 TetR/AcrR family transcriptional regulator [Gracilibacillus sp. S3-1-1]
MARGFTHHEKEVINEALLKQGKEHFIRYGFKKTNISELSKLAGIAQGTFYKFYDSKEALFFDILNKEEAKVKDLLLNENITRGEITRASFKKFLMKALDLIDNNPFIQMIFIGGEYDNIFKRLSPDQMQNHIDRDEKQFIPLVEMWQESGRLVQEEPDVIVGTLRAFFLLLLHKEDIGEEIHDQTMEFMATCLSNSLIIEG